MDGRTFTRAFLAVLAVGLLVAYGASFGVGFYFDDSYGIRENPAIRSLANIPSFFTDPFTLTPLRQNVDVRPVLVTTYALNYAISGTSPWSYHLFNLIAHFLAATMVFVLVRDHVWWPAERRGPEGGARIPAAAAALFFAFAPINNQALNYMWARSALLCTVFFLAAFLAMMRGRLLAAVLLHALALLTKAIAITLPVVFVVYDFLYRDRERHPDLRSWLRDWRELVVPVAPLLVVDMLYLALRSAMLPPWAGDALHESWVTPWIWCISQWPALLHYVRIFVWPTGLSVDHDFPYTLSIAEFAAGGSLLVLATWIGAALWWSWRYPQAAFATMWFFITLAPESTFAPLAEVVNDHRPYIASSLGLSVLLAWLLERAASYAGRRRREVFIAFAAMLCAAALVLGARRTLEWADEEKLWDSTVATSPTNGRAWMNSGLVQFHKGNLKEARRRYERARQFAPAYPYLYMNLSALEMAEGHIKEAVEQGRQSVRFGPELSKSYYYLGLALEKQGNVTEAATSLRRAAALDPNDAAAKSASARTAAAQAAADAKKAETALMAEGLRLLDGDREAERAAGVFRELLKRSPGHYGATYQLARSLDAAHRPEEAAPLWQKMLILSREARDKQTEAKVRERLSRGTP